MGDLAIDQTMIIMTLIISGSPRRGLSMSGRSSIRL